MPIDAGKLDKRITLQSSSKTKSATGKITITWSDMGAVWCQFVDSRGREFMAARQVNSKITHVLKVRYRSDVTSEWRAKFGSAILNFNAVVNPGQQNVELLIEAIQESA